MASLDIKFQTSELVPPPHAHAVELKIKSSTSGLTYVYDLEFIDREGISPDELAEEGCSEHDNLSLSGSLPAVWTNAFSEILANTKPLHIKELREEQPFWDICEDKRHFYPSNSPAWELLIDEFKQAILESKQYEAPLTITVLRIGEDGTTSYEIMGKFENRTLILSHNNQVKNIAWKDLSRLLKDFFAGEMLPDKTTQKLPTKTGLYIDYGDGYWYQLGFSLLTKPSKITNWLEF